MLQEAIDKQLLRRADPDRRRRRDRVVARARAEEGIFTGISGGATFAVAHAGGREGAGRLRDPRMLPDTGERYLSTPLFEGIVEGMDDAEIAVMKSTPNFQMPS